MPESDNEISWQALKRAIADRPFLPWKVFAETHIRRWCEASQQKEFIKRIKTTAEAIGVNVRIVPGYETDIVTIKVPGEDGRNRTTMLDVNMTDRTLRTALRRFVP